MRLELSKGGGIRCGFGNGGEGWGYLWADMLLMGMSRFGGGMLKLLPAAAVCVAGVHVPRDASERMAMQVGKLYMSSDLWHALHVDLELG